MKVLENYSPLHFQSRFFFHFVIVECLDEQVSQALKTHSHMRPTPVLHSWNAEYICLVFREVSWKVRQKEWYSDMIVKMAKLPPCAHTLAHFTSPPVEYQL